MNNIVHKTIVLILAVCFVILGNVDGKTIVGSTEMIMGTIWMAAYVILSALPEENKK